MKISLTACPIELNWVAYNLYINEINFRHHTFTFLYIKIPQIIEAVLGAKRCKWKKKESSYLPSVA